MKNKILLSIIIILLPITVFMLSKQVSPKPQNSNDQTSQAKEIYIDLLINNLPLHFHHQICGHFQKKKKI